MNDPRHELRQALQRHAARQWLLVAAGLAAVLLAALASVSLGVESIPPGQIVRGIFSGLLPSNWSADIAPMQLAILQNLRLPRTLMAIVAGAGLSLAGVAMQGVTRNPLASPYTLGISPAAAFGASLAILFGFAAIPGTGHYWIVLGAFCSALACSFLVLGLSALRGVTSTMLILTGIAFTYFFAALTATVHFVATEQQLAAIIQWTFGSLNGSTWEMVGIAGGIQAVVAAVLLAHAWALNAFAGGGDEVAASLGFAVGRTRAIVIVTAALAVAGVVSFTGVIAFVGLVAPHIARIVIGGDHRTLLPFSAIVGAFLLLIADMVGRLAFAPVIIPVGIVVAYLGVPLFLHLLLSRRQELLA